jgi:hypothetical protein
MRWAGHVTHMRESSYRVFGGEKKTGGNRPLGKNIVHGRIILNWILEK